LKIKNEELKRLKAESGMENLQMGQRLLAWGE
jgi:hypothetical protein